MIAVDNPLKWLLTELPAYIPPDRLAELLERYEAQKWRYYTAVKINDLTRNIRTAERFTPTSDRVAQIARWRARLAELKQSLEGQ